ncbi:uncharacterized CRM domain-containing protein At3g25440, chloroplastic [Aristolochia californica]|uniref:uncharacterized CRM domain-containing protein At3g25440, chloroplastic n=1 Tax=Aristolochia californica TaxID=171875 RepID=UPI0035D599EB
MAFFFRVIHEMPRAFPQSPVATVCSRLSTRWSLIFSSSIDHSIPCFSLVPITIFSSQFSTHVTPPPTSYSLAKLGQELSTSVYSPVSFLSIPRSYLYKCPSSWLKWQHCYYTSNARVTLKEDNDVVRFCIDKPAPNERALQKEKKFKRAKMSKKAKINELRLYRLKAKKKMRSPNPEVRIRYKLEKVKRKEEWLIEKLRKFENPKLPQQVYDPEILTEEERFFLKRTGEKKKNYVPVGKRGVFGGVVLNMHLHWKKHETVKVVCKPCKPGQVYQYADELARLSKGIVIDIKPDNTIIFYRGKNYAQPDVMSPPDTLSKAKALEKYKFEQSLEHTSQFIEKLEKELEDYHKHVALYKQTKEVSTEKATERL